LSSGVYVLGAFPGDGVCCVYVNVGSALVWQTCWSQ